MSYDRTLPQHFNLYPHIPLSDEEPDRYAYAQADLSFFRGVCPPEEDQLIRKTDVQTLFCAAFDYTEETFRKLSHADLIEHPYYWGDFAWRTREGSEQSCITRYYKSRVIALIMAMKRAPINRITGEVGKVEYPHSAKPAKPAKQASLSGGFPDAESAESAESES